MQLKRILTSIILVLIYIFPGVEQSKVFSLHKNIQIVKCDNAGIIVEINFKAPEFTLHPINGEIFDLATIEDCDLFRIPGYPQVPIDGTLLAIPVHGNYRLEILEVQPEIMSNRLIQSVPYIDYSTVNEQSPQIEYKPLAEIYQQNHFFPAEWAEIGGENFLRNQRVVRLQFNPLRFNPVSREVIFTSYIKVAIYFQNQPNSINSSSFISSDPYFEKIAQGSILNSHQAKSWIAPKTLSFQKQASFFNQIEPFYKIQIKTEGLYHLSYDWFKQNSVPAEQFDPQTIKILNRGEEIPIYVHAKNEQFSTGDFIEFYAEPNRNDSSYFDPYTDTNIYWLTRVGESGRRISIKSSTSKSAKLIKEVVQTIHLEQENVYHSGDTNTEIYTTEQVPSEGWIWRFFYKGESLSIPLEIANLAPGADEAEIRVRFHGTTYDVAFPDHALQVEVNQQVVGKITFNDRDFAILDTTFDAKILQNGQNLIKITSVGVPGTILDQTYLDWVELDVPVRLETETDEFNFSVPPQNRHAQFSLRGLTSDSIRIYEVNRQEFILPLFIKREKESIISLTSAGFKAGAFVNIEMAGQKLINPGRRGFNLVTIDSSGQILEKRDFDTFQSAENADSLAQFIQKQPTGTYILAAIRDEGAQFLNEAAKASIEQIGSTQIRKVGIRDSWGIIGRKGAAPGAVPEVYKSANEGVAAIVDTLNFYGTVNEHHVVFADSLFEAKKYVVSTPDSMKIPHSIKLDTLANLFDSKNQADYIIITHPKFQFSAQQLAEHRRQFNQIQVKVVLIGDIYDEFNHGIENPHAIREFLKYAYNNWQAPAPFAVVLFGDASWDMRMNSSTSTKINYVPSFGNPVSDHWFVCLDGGKDYLPEMIIGRIAVETEAMAKFVVDKIIEYDQLTPAAWQKDILFITGGFDSWEQSLFINQSRRLNQNFVLPPPAACQGIMINKTTDGRFEGEKKTEILAGMNRGKLWINFLGHAGSRTWDLMFNNPDVDEIDNPGKYFFITSMTCHTARFATPESNCFGELFVNRPQNGAIAFWGTSGWGFLDQDYILLEKLFPTILADTVHSLGSATTAAKINLYSKYGAGLFNLVSIQQYTLIGDPLTEIALSKTPELVLQKENIQLQPEIPVEADSTVFIKVKVQNWGLATPDSVELEILDVREGQPAENIGNELKFPPIGLEDSLTVAWSVGGKAGEHRLDLMVDPRFLIQEITHDNNSQTLPVYIYSSTLTISKPINYQVIQTPTTFLQVNSSLNYKSQLSVFYEFELDTSLLFNSPLLKSVTVPETLIITRWQTPELQNQTTYFWRCRVITGDEIGTWVQSSFYVDFSATDFQIRMNHPGQLSESVLNGTEMTQEGIKLQLQSHSIEVQSGGFADGNLARIYLDQKVVMEAGRGFNLAVIDARNARVSKTINFDTWSNPAAADSMAQFIQNVENNQYICVAIKDEGRRFLNENAKQALESIGSQYCRQIGGRDSWAIIGIKRAPPGTVPESYKPTGTGLATVSLDFTGFINSGTIISPILGPAKTWYKCNWTEQIPSIQDPILHQIVAFNQTTSQWDTLNPILSDAQGVDLSFIDSHQYARLKVLTRLTSFTGEFSPMLKSWNLFYEPVPDLATCSAVIKIDPDSAMHRQEFAIQADIFNVGLASADSFQVYFYGKTAKPERFLIRQPVLVRNLLPDSLICIPMLGEAIGNFNLMDIFVEIDPYDTVRELFNFNNSGKTSIYVAGDSTKPAIKITFDGREIQEGDWVNSQPQIRIQIFDNSPVALIDTSQVRLFLNDKIVSYGGNYGQLTLVPNLEASVSNLKATLLYRPDLEDGTHQLTLLVKDASQNLTYFQIGFSVATELKILDVLNYPNPFQIGTTFTYILTQAADNAKIYIYTLSGKLIRKIVNAPYQVGFNQYFWNGRDQEQDEIANGVYLYEVTAQQGQKKVSKISKLIHIR
jgi:hypothetical protein